LRDISEEKPQCQIIVTEGNGTQARRYPSRRWRRAAGGEKGCRGPVPPRLDWLPAGADSDGFMSARNAGATIGTSEQILGSFRRANTRSSTRFVRMSSVASVK